ncbi:hypothetical protein E2320_004967, partial [Naja naja]
SLGRWALPA